MLESIKHTSVNGVVYFFLLCGVISKSDTRGLCVNSHAADGDITDAESLVVSLRVIPRIYAYEELLAILYCKHRLRLYQHRIVGCHVLTLEDSGAGYEIVCRIVHMGAHAVTAGTTKEE